MNIRHGRGPVFLLLFCLLLIGSAGCSWLWPSPPQDNAVARSDLARDLDPNVSAAEVSQLVSGDSAFALDLFHEIAEGDANVFFSPHSISSALAMSYAGARGETETQMADALHFELRQETLHVAFDWLDLELNGRGEVSPPYEGEGFDLHVVNAVWGQRGHPFRSSYLDTLAVNYGAGLRLLDFSGDPDGSRITINEWVSGQTNERIQDLLPSGSISEVTRLVLTNAIYFNAPWLYPFDEKETKARSFLPVSGPSFSVPMMYQRGTFSYARGGNVQVVELPYNGGKLAMLLLVPDGGQLAAFEDALDLAGYEAIVTALEARQVDLWLPRFEFTYDVSLLHPLTALGMADAFTPDVADFSGIDGSRGLFVADVLHKAFVSVDEAGTEAAAATAVVIGGTGAPATPVTLVIDRPFLFVIRDIPTDAILFVGRVMEP